MAKFNNMHMSLEENGNKKMHFTDMYEFSNISVQERKQKPHYMRV